MRGDGVHHSSPDLRAFVFSVLESPDGKLTILGNDGDLANERHHAPIDHEEVTVADARVGQGVSSGAHEECRRGSVDE